MHEYSIVQALLDLCEDEAKKAGAVKVNTIRIKVGKLSGVEPELLKAAYDVFNEESFCRGAKLDMQLQNVVITCRDCGKESELETLTFVCPHCHSESFEVKDGEELMLMSLEME
ncbi:MAG: hydrogenase/urease nickel incorporation protein HypA [Campylobacterales bacterium]